MTKSAQQPDNDPLKGLLVVDKPLYWSSAKVVYWVKRATNRVKTGHAGTLDPLATGIVVCCLGRATKSVEAIMAMPKTYETTINLTAFSTTDDLEGELTEVEGVAAVDKDVVRETLEQFVGEIQQKPPIFSAINIEGKRAYKLARKGEDIDIPARTVRVDTIELLRYEFPELELRITCGKGTYIRSMAKDIGNALGTGGYLTTLRRTAVGPYDESVAIQVERLNDPIEQCDLIEAPEPPKRKKRKRKRKKE